MRGLSLLVMLAGGVAAANAGDNRPNIVLFVVDDLGWTDWQHDPELNPTGSVVYETPNVLHLARTGTVFDNAYAASCVCSPTRAALLTGKWPARTRMTDYVGASPTQHGRLRSPPASQSLELDHLTLPEALRQAGYDTAFFGKWHVGHAGASADPLEHGFDSNISGTSFGNPYAAGGFFAGDDGMWAGMPGIDTPGRYEPTDYLSDAISGHAAAYLAERASARRPFFAMVSHYVVHTPIQGPDALVAKYAEKIQRLRAAGVDLRGHDDPKYAAMVEKMDQSLGRLLDRLTEAEDPASSAVATRQTIVAFTSDNGGLWTPQAHPTRNLPLREGKGSLYEGGIRVPLIVRVPGADPADRVLSDPVVSHDLYPTLLELAGVAIPNEAGSSDGVSFAATLRGDDFERPPICWHYPHVSPQHARSDTIEGGSFVSAIRDERWKLLWKHGGASPELYDLVADIGESEDLTGRRPQIAARLSGMLADALQDADAQMPIDVNTGGSIQIAPLLATHATVIQETRGDSGRLADPAVYLAPVVADFGKSWPRNQRVTIVCHGHSVPTGYFTGGVVRPFDAYPHLLRIALKRRHPTAVINVVCTGIGGENAEGGAARFERDVLPLRPDVVAIDYALNDRAIGLARARIAWQRMLDAAEQAGVSVILMTPTADTTANAGDENDPLEQHARQIRELASRRGVALADSLAAFRRFVRDGGDLQVVMAQSNHPNRAGHELVVPGLLEWFDGPITAGAGRSASRRDAKTLPSLH